MVVSKSQIWVKLHKIPRVWKTWTNAWSFGVTRKSVKVQTNFSNHFYITYLLSGTYINSNDIILYYIASSSHLDITFISNGLKPFLKIWSSSLFSVLMIKTKISLSIFIILRLTAKWPWLCKPSLNSNFLQKVLFDYVHFKKIV